MEKLLSEYKKEAKQSDETDPLKSYRKEFVIGSEPLIYLDGNSLGRLAIESKRMIEEVVSKEWGDELIRSWNSGWWNMPERAAVKISQLIGARANEVIVCDSTSVNLYKLVSAALKINSGKLKVVSEEINFPTDLYVLQGVINELDMGHQLLLAKSDDGIRTEQSALEEIIDHNTAVVVLTHVSFKSSAMYEMKQITELAHRHGALVIWDLSHSVGAVPVDLNLSGADMAVGCTYKYLNCGPGSPAFLYVSEKLIDRTNSPIWGWIGDKNPFDFNISYKPSTGIKKFMTGTPGVISMCTIEPSVDILLRAGIENLRVKSIEMTQFFIKMYKALLTPYGFLLGSPEDPLLRGSHISLKHKEAYRISRALLDPEYGGNVIIPDFRPPDNLRFGFAPLYNTFGEIYLLTEQLRRIMDNGVYRMYSVDKAEVT